MKEENTNTSPFKDDIDSYITLISAEASAVPLVMQLLTGKILADSKKINEFIKLKGITIDADENGESNTISIPMEHIVDFEKMQKDIDDSMISIRLMQINFIVSFVSQFDAYLGCLIRTMYLVKPEMLNGCDNQILFSDLLKFQSIDDAKEFIVSKQVDNVLRDSHSKQFKWLEKQLNITLTKDLNSFSKFIEITERRNLFVHCNGKVSQQYIDICKENNVCNVNNAKVGQTLSADSEYFKDSFSVLYEIGVKLGQVIWRKLDPQTMNEADNHLNDICFQLLSEGRYDIALTLLNFATDVLKKHSSEEIRLYFIINKALALYLMNKKEESDKILDSNDWSAVNNVINLGVSVLREDYDTAVKLMTAIGDNDKISKEAYRHWPIFTKFRKSEQFTSTYKIVFKEDFMYSEQRPSSFKEISSEITNIIKKRQKK